LVHGTVQVERPRMEITGAQSLSSVKQLIARCGLPKCLRASLLGVVGPTTNSGRLTRRSKRLLSNRLARRAASLACRPHRAPRWPSICRVNASLLRANWRVFCGPPGDCPRSVLSSRDNAGSKGTALAEVLGGEVRELAPEDNRMEFGVRLAVGRNPDGCDVLAAATLPKFGTGK
jgi:hypothetical protein